MTKDPIIAELRRFRDSFARKHRYSIRAMAEDLRRFHPAQPAGAEPRMRRPLARLPLDA